ncbi:MAG: GAF domain-containing protein [Desulfosarcina sp.]
MNMSAHHIVKRGTARRLADRQQQDRLAKYSRLIQAGQVITAELKFEALFEVIFDQTRRILEVERCSIFLIDEDQQKLCSFVAADMASNQFQFSKDQGIAGWVFCNQTPQIVNNVYADRRFYREVDRQTGFKTKNLLCVPLISHTKNCLGTMQVLNKKRDDFTQEDVDILSYMAVYVAVALENSSLYEELRATDRARQKAVNHLSHELKTPLAVIAAVLSRCAATAQTHDLTHLTKTIERGRRGIDRLYNIQEKVDDIVGNKHTDSEKQTIKILDDLISLIEEAAEDKTIQCRPLADHVIDRIKSIFEFEPEKIETVRLDLFLKNILRHATEAIGDRDLNLSLEIEDELFIKMDPKILGKICEGLLKNAIENTPDGGTIELKAKAAEEQIRLVIQDYGVGITSANQKNIFKGFFHTQSTQHYSSKTPYLFDAGGTGTDLLRIKTYAERLGFGICFSSQRCRHIPAESDVCPGKITLCTHIDAESECHRSGGSRFTVRFSKLGSLVDPPSPFSAEKENVD